jgi:hypothetical protein
MICFIPETGDHRISGSFNLFPQHCLLPTLNPVQYVKAVHDELRDAIISLPKKRRQRLQKAILKSLASIEMQMQQPQRVTAEGNEPSQQRVAAAAPPITTTTNPTNPHVLATKP